MNQQETPTRNRELDAMHNGLRLVEDSILLNKHGRYSSAFALAVLALEELGKILLWRWEREGPLPRGSKNLTYHIRKQLAVAFFNSAPPLIDKIISDKMTHDEESVKVLAKFMAESEEAKMIWIAAIGATERTKHLAFYDDCELPDPNLRAQNVSEVDVKGVLEEAKRAARGMEHILNHKVARTMYCLHLTSSAKSSFGHD